MIHSWSGCFRCHCDMSESAIFCPSSRVFGVLAATCVVVSSSQSFTSMLASSPARTGARSCAARARPTLMMPSRSAVVVRVMPILRSEALQGRVLGPHLLPSRLEVARGDVHRVAVPEVVDLVHQTVGRDGGEAV